MKNNQAIVSPTVSDYNILGLDCVNKDNIDKINNIVADKFDANNNSIHSNSEGQIREIVPKNC